MTVLWIIDLIMNKIFSCLCRCDLIPLKSFHVVFPLFCTTPLAPHSISPGNKQLSEAGRRLCLHGPQHSPHWPRCCLPIRMQEELWHEVSHLSKKVWLFSSELTCVSSDLPIISPWSWIITARSLKIWFTSIMSAWRGEWGGGRLTDEQSMLQCSCLCGMSYCSGWYLQLFNVGLSLLDDLQVLLSDAGLLKLSLGLTQLILPAIIQLIYILILSTAQIII